MSNNIIRPFQSKLIANTTTVDTSLSGILITQTINAIKLCDIAFVLYHQDYNEKSSRTATSSHPSTLALRTNLLSHLPCASAPSSLIQSGFCVPAWINKLSLLSETTSVHINNLRFRICNHRSALVSIVYSADTKSGPEQLYKNTAFS